VDLAGLSSQFEAPGEHIDRFVDPPDDLRRLAPTLEILNAQGYGPISRGVLLAGLNPPRRAVGFAGGLTMASVVDHRLALLADPAIPWQCSG
jgi:hypothetical protein